MGADIHLYVEKLVEDEWCAVVPPERDLERWPLGTSRSPFWGPNGCMYTSDCDGFYDHEHNAEILCVGDACPKCLGTGRDPRWHQKRNYTLFGVLAGVRHPDLKLIRKVRGAPEDLSVVVRDYNSLGHTPSWLTVHEVMTYLWSVNETHWGSITVATRPRRSRSVRESCADFIAFVSTFVEPLLGDDFASIKSVASDLLEQERRRGAECDPLADFEWLTVKTKDKHAPELRAEAKRIASTVRFVFGFDS